jgi:hypothetical protein
MLDEIDWGSLDHAYGPATDTPTHLAALTSACPDAQRAALDHLDVAVLHQGFPESATAPAARVVTQLLADGNLASEVRHELIEFLGAVAIATAMAEEKEEAWEKLLAGLEQAIHQSYPVVLSFLEDSDPSVRKTALDAAVSHVNTRVLAEEKPLLAARLRTWANEPSEDRAFFVRCLGELGDDTQHFLSDPSTKVRVCAALAPAAADNDMATDIIIAALSREADHLRNTAGNHGATLDPLVEFLLERDVGSTDLCTLGELVKAVTARVDDFRRIAEPATTIVRSASWAGFDTTWGPLLLAAFRTPYNQRTSLSAEQRDVLAALVANPGIWDYTNGSSSLVFRRAGLPFQRETCARIAQ